MSAAVAGYANVGGLDLTAAVKGTIGTSISVKAVIDPAGATGANTLVESGCRALVKLANDGAGNVLSTISGVKASLNSGALVSAALHAAATGANTGAEFSGASDSYLSFTGGADATGGGIYDDLAAATGDGWTLQNKAAPSGTSAHIGYDQLEKVISSGNGVGRRVKVTAEASTGAQLAVNAAGAEEARYFQLNRPRVLKKLGATGANEYAV